MPPPAIEDFAHEQGPNDTTLDTKGLPEADFFCRGSHMNWSKREITPDVTDLHEFHH